MKLERIQREQEGFRLALMGDAVAVAASAVFFAVRLVDATFDLYVSSALYGTSLETSREAAERYQTFLNFKASEELRSMAISLVLPLLLMRVLGSVKDSVYSIWLQDGNTARKVLDVIDCVVLSFTGFYSFLSIPPLETKLRSLKVSGGPVWEHKGVLEAFDTLEISHLIALAQAGLLMLVSLLKLSARLERSSVRIIERAQEMDSIEKLFDEKVRRLEESKVSNRPVVQQEPRIDQGADSDSSTSSSSRPSPEQIRAPVETPTAEEATEPTEPTDVIPRMDTDEFYKLRGWKRITVAPTTSVPSGRVDFLNEKGESMTASDVMMGGAVSVVTFLTVQYLHDPVVKLLRA